MTRLFLSAPFKRGKPVDGIDVSPPATGQMTVSNEWIVLKDFKLFDCVLITALIHAYFYNHYAKLEGVTKVYEDLMKRCADDMSLCFQAVTSSVSFIKLPPPPKRKHLFEKQYAQPFSAQMRIREVTGGFIEDLKTWKGSA